MVSLILEYETGHPTKFPNMPNTAKCLRAGGYPHILFNIRSLAYSWSIYNAITGQEIATIRKPWTDTRRVIRLTIEETEED